MQATQARRTCGAGGGTRPRATASSSAARAAGSHSPELATMLLAATARVLGERRRERGAGAVKGDAQRGTARNKGIRMC